MVVKNRLWTGYCSAGRSLAGDRQVRWHPSESEGTTASDLLYQKLYFFFSLIFIFLFSRNGQLFFWDIEGGIFALLPGAARCIISSAPSLRPGDPLPTGEAGTPRVPRRHAEWLGGCSSPARGLAAWLPASWMELLGEEII